MTEEDERIELFDRYTSDQLSEEELSSFQSKLSEEPDFRMDFEAYNQSRMMIESAGVAEDMKEIIEADKKKGASWFPLGIAASIAVIISLYFLFESQSPTPEALFETYYQPYPNLVATRSSGFAEMNKGLSAYGKGDYQSALDEFSMLGYKNDTLKFYHALAHLSFNQADSALQLFNEIPHSSIFKQQVKWYKALSLLKLNRLEDSKSLLSEIGTGEFNSRQTEELIDSLED